MATNARPTPSETAALTDVRERLSEIIDHAATSQTVFTVTKHGQPMAVIIGFDEYESLIETMNILSDDETMSAVSEARSELIIRDDAR